MNLLWNILLALVWAAITGTFTLGNLVIGFVLSYLVLYLTRRGLHRPGYFRRTRAALGLVGYVAWELVLANLRLARDVVRYRIHARPGIVAVPLDASTDVEITLLANLITLTPGTLSLDVSEDRRVLYVHALYVDDPEKLRREIKHSFERRLLEAMR